MTLRKKITSQFWAGQFDSAERFMAFVNEDDAYYAEENEDRDDIALSQFAASQGARSYDHDFFEAGFEDAPGPATERFRDYSWCPFWAEDFEARARDAGLPDWNAFLMLGVENQPNGITYHHIREPRSADGAGWKLVYLGEITHDDYPT